MAASMAEWRRDAARLREGDRVLIDTYGERFVRGTVKSVLSTQFSYYPDDDPDTVRYAAFDQYRSRV